jgi:hypothetical protein
MVAGTATAVGVALLNDRRLSPAFAEAAPAPPRTTLSRGTIASAALPETRTFITRRILYAAVLALGGIAIAASVPALTAFATNMWLPASSTQTAVAQGPSNELRAAAGVAGNWERSIASATAPIEALGALAIAGKHERDYQELVAALEQLHEQEKSRAAAAAPRGTAFSRNAASGYAAGTILSARITIYGCVGPGGGFCGGMAGGGRVFEGAAACSSNLPFGTKVKIHGDPTGRIYECLDRGALPATWVDVYFYNTSDGIAWQSLLGGTIAQIEIVN